MAGLDPCWRLREGGAQPHMKDEHEGTEGRGLEKEDEPSPPSLSTLKLGKQGVDKLLSAMPLRD